MPVHFPLSQSVLATRTADGKTRVFVYGTLRRGQRNHRALADAKFVGAGETVARYTLRVEGTLPFLDAREARYAVRGEVYEIDSAGLTAIDRLEGHPRWYQRRVISIRLDRRAQGAVRKMVEAFAYFHPEAPGDVHPTGDYAEPLNGASITEKNS